ncbi:MBL fold metallo-hydrolase [Amnibacterium kyonggiense]|uniref:N-acyl homoserine lactone hydrolase n=1 Tax=Amnibacterium kyonggiense TaxID=595671 RepID=A0A4R7FJB1_9MICO|nr:MBL fold metallo-hydrolase [Amnibacterium kyonggiense]TDS76086.1 N-acyl homoserine lactone hydrolase [Amnibacterium kyonggiense]
MRAGRRITITPLLVGDLLVAEDERLPIFVHLIDHPDGRLLVDTGVTELHPALADMEPRLHPLTEHDLDLASIDVVVNTHLHADHCGGNHLFAGTPILVQRTELADASEQEDYTLRDWVHAPGVEYVEVDGDHEALPGVRLLAAPGHTRGSQIVVVDGEDGPVMIAGDTAVWGGELDEPTTQGQRRIRSLEPTAVWLAHASDPWRPPTA